MAAVDNMSLYHVYSSYSLNPYIFLHKSHVVSPYIYLCAIHPPIPPFSPMSPFITPCLNLSIRTLSAVLELPPTAIHPFNPPIPQSVPQTWSYPLSWPFYTPINFWNMTSQSSIFSPPSSIPPVYPPLSSFMSSHQVKDLALLISHHDFFFC